MLDAQMEIDPMPRKKTLRITALAFLLLCLNGASLSDAASSQYMQAKKDGVLVRSGPDTKKQVLFEIFENYPLKVLKRQGKWVQVVDQEGDKGWVYAPLLAPGTGVIVTAKEANLRLAPETKSKIVAKVMKGVVLEKVETKGGWYQLRHANGTTGWMNRSLVWP